MDIADVLVHRAVPDDAEDVADAVVAQVFEKADVAAQFENVVADRPLEVRGSEMGGQGALGFLGESERPGDIGRSLPPERHPDDLSLRHRKARSLNLIVMTKIPLFS